MDSIDPAISNLLAARQNAMQTQAAFAVAAKSLAAQKQQGEAMAQLIDAAAQLGKALGRGGAFDAVA